MSSPKIPKLLLDLEQQPALLRAPGAWEPGPLLDRLESMERTLDAVVLLDEWKAAAPRGIAALIARIDEVRAARLGKILCCWRLQLGVPGPLTAALEEALALAWPALPPAYREVAALWSPVQRAWGLPAPDPLDVDPSMLAPWSHLLLGGSIPCGSGQVPWSLFRDRPTCRRESDRTVDACIDNRCVNDPPHIDDVIASDPPTQAGSLCLAPGCCYTNSDCADGSRLTVDTCVKTGLLQGPNVKGTCSSK